MKKQIKLDKETHTYSDVDNGEVYVSTTQLLTKHKIVNTYDELPSSIIAQAREKGNLIHSEVENWIKNKVVPLTDEATLIVDFLKNKKDIESELMVYDSSIVNYAGTIDIVEHNDDGTVSLYDIKTGIYNNNAVAWQLSLYAKAYKNVFNADVKNLYCLSCRFNQGLKVIETTAIPDLTINTLLTAEKNNSIYEPIVLLPQLADDKQIDVIRQFIEFKKTLKNMETQYNEVVHCIEEQMANAGVKTATSLDGTLQFTYIPETVKTVVDTTKLKEKEPDIYEKYLKTSTVKASIRITNKNKDKE